MNRRYKKWFDAPKNVFPHPSSFFRLPSSFIPHPSSLILHPSSFIPLPCKNDLLPMRNFLFLTRNKKFRVRNIKRYCLCKSKLIAEDGCFAAKAYCFMKVTIISETAENLAVMSVHIQYMLLFLVSIWRLRHFS